MVRELLGLADLALLPVLLNQSKFLPNLQIQNGSPFFKLVDCRISSHLNVNRTVNTVTALPKLPLQVSNETFNEDLEVTLPFLSVSVSLRAAVLIPENLLMKLFGTGADIRFGVQEEFVWAEVNQEVLADLSLNLVND